MSPPTQAFREGLPCDGQKVSWLDNWRVAGARAGSRDLPVPIMSDVPRNAGMVVAFAVGKLALTKISSDAKLQSKNPKSFSLALLRGILGGLSFVCGGASAFHLALVLSTKVARLGQTAWCFGSALVYWAVLHIVGRKLFPGSRNSIERAQQRELMSKAEQSKKSKASVVEMPAPEPSAAEPPVLGGTAGLGPAFTRGEIEPPAGEKTVGSATIGVYTAEQQARLGVDEEGKKLDDEHDLARFATCRSEGELAKLQPEPEPEPEPPASVYTVGYGSLKLLPCFGMLRDSNGVLFVCAGLRREYTCMRDTDPLAKDPVKVPVKILTVEDGGKYAVQVVAGDGDRKLQLVVGGKDDPLPHLCERTELQPTGEMLDHTVVAQEMVQSKDMMDDI